MLNIFFKKKENYIKPKEIGIRMCLQDTCNRFEITKLIIEKDLFGFDPEFMNINYNSQAFSKEQALFLLQNIEKTNSIIFQSKNEGVSLTIGYQAVITPSLVISWRTNGENLDERLFQTIESLSLVSGFICCYIYDYWDEYWQSAKFESDFEIYSRDHRHLKRVENKFGELEIDTSNNFGKLEILQKVNIMAAPIMYFGDWYNLNVCSFEKIIANFQYTELKNQILRVTLYEPFYTPNRNEQKRFLETIEIENIRLKYNRSIFD